MDLPGPSWYQLETVASTDQPQTSKSMGEFYVQMSHVHVCSHRSVSWAKNIFFYSLSHVCKQDVDYVVSHLKCVEWEVMQVPIVS